ncbi:unnamed protein product, partial [Effrenium voratum]
STGSSFPSPRSRARHGMRSCVLGLAISAGSLICIFLGNASTRRLAFLHFRLHGGHYLQGSKGNKTSQATPETEPELRLALFMTTHWSALHQGFLPCWGFASKHLNLLRQSDLVIYTSKRPKEEQLAQLHFRNITVREHKAAGYQAGAIQALVDGFGSKGFEEKWFEQYDWVIRLNPDVLIMDAEWLQATMQNDSVDAIFQACDKMRIHTDFFAVRVRAVNHTLVDVTRNGNAEMHATLSFGNIKKSGRFVWVRGGEPAGSSCKIMGNRSAAVHNHSLVKFCPDYFRERSEQYWAPWKKKLLR